MSEKQSLTPEIQKLLNKVKARERCLRHVKGLFFFVLALCAITLIGALFDRFVPATRFTRWAVAWGAYGVSLACLFLLWLRPAGKSITNVEAAWLVERGVGKLDERLVSTVELSEHEDEFDFLSLPMIRELAKSTAEEAATVQLDRVSPLSRIKRPAFVLSGVAVVFMVLAAIPQVSLHRLSARFWYPDVRYGRIGSFKLEVLSAVNDRVALGEPYQFHIHATSPDVESVFLDISLANGEKRAKEIFKDAEGDFRFEFEDTLDSFSYQAKAHHVSTDVLGVSVLPRPEVEEFVKIIDWPEYTGRLTTREVSSAADMEALPGSKGKLIIRTAAAAQGFILIGEDRKELGRVEDRDGLSFLHEFDFTPTKFRLSFLSNEGMRSKDDTEYSIGLLSDTAPAIQLLGLSDDQALFDAGVMKLRFRAEDDFGIAHVSVVYSVNGASTRETIIQDDMKPGQNTQLDSSYEWNFGGVSSEDSNLDFSLMVVDHSGRSGRTHSIFVSRRDKIVTQAEKSLAQRTTTTTETSTRISKDLSRLKEIVEELRHADERHTRNLLGEENILANRVAEDFKKLINNLSSAEITAKDSPQELSLRSLRESAESIARIELPEFELSRGVKNVLVENHAPAIDNYGRELSRLADVASKLESAAGLLHSKVRAVTLAKQLSNQVARFDGISKARRMVQTPEAREKLDLRSSEVIRQTAPVTNELRKLAESVTRYPYTPQFQRLDDDIQKAVAALNRDPKKQPGTSWFNGAKDINSHRLPHLNTYFDGQFKNASTTLASSRPTLKAEFARLADGLKVLEKVRGDLSPLEARVRKLTNENGLVMRMLDHPNGVQRAESYDELLREFANRKELWAGVVEQVNIDGNPYTTQQASFLIQYDGWLYIREPGEYTFGLIADDCAYLRIDEKVVQGIMSCPPYPLEVISAQPMELAIGRYPIQLLFGQGIGAAVVSLHWKKPGTDEFTLVPGDAFKPQGREHYEETPLQKLARKLFDAHLKAATLKKTELQQKLSLIADSFDRESGKLKLEGEEIIQPRADLIMMSGVLASIRHLLDGNDQGKDLDPETTLKAVAVAEPVFKDQRDVELALRSIRYGAFLIREFQRGNQISRPERHASLRKLALHLEVVKTVFTELSKQPGWDTDTRLEFSKIPAFISRGLSYTQAVLKETHESNEEKQLATLGESLQGMNTHGSNIRDALTVRNLPLRDRLVALLPTASQQVYASADELIQADKHINVARDKTATPDLPYGILENAPEAMKRMIAAERELENISTRLRADALGEITRKIPDVEKAAISASAALALDKVRKGELDRTMNGLDAAFGNAGLHSGEGDAEDQKLDGLLLSVLANDEKTRVKLNEIAALLEEVEKGMRGEVSNKAFLAARDKLNALAGDEGRAFKRLAEAMRAKKELKRLESDVLKANQKGGEDRLKHLAKTSEESDRLKQDLARRTPGSELMKEELKDRALRKIAEDAVALAQFNREPDQRKRDEAAADLIHPYKPLMEKLGLNEEEKFAEQSPQSQLSKLNAEVKKLDTKEIELPEELAKVAVSDVTTETPRTMPFDQIRKAANTADELAAKAAEVDRKEKDFDAAQSSHQANVAKAQKEAVATNEKLAEQLSKAMGGELENDARTEALSTLNAIQRPLREEMGPAEVAAKSRQAANEYRQAANNIEPLIAQSTPQNQPAMRAMRDALSAEAARLDRKTDQIAAEANDLQRTRNELAAQRQQLAQQTHQARQQAESVAAAIEAADSDIRTQPLRALTDQMREAAADQGQAALPEVQPLAANLRDRLNEIADEAEQADAPQQALALLENPVQTLADSIPQQPVASGQPQTAAASREVRDALRPVASELKQVQQASEAVKKAAAARQMEELALEDLEDQRQANLNNLSSRLGEARQNLAQGVDPNTARRLQDSIDKAREAIDQNPESPQEVQGLQEQLGQLAQQLEAAPSLNPDVQREQRRLAQEMRQESQQLAQRQQEIAAKEAAIEQKEKQEEALARNLEKQSEELATATDKIADYVEEKTSGKKTEEAFPKVAEARRKIRELEPYVEDINELAEEVAQEKANHSEGDVARKSESEAATLENLSELDERVADLEAIVAGQDLEADNSEPDPKEKLTLWKLRDQAEAVRLLCGQLLEKEGGPLTGRTQLERQIQIQRELSINRINETIGEFAEVITYLKDEPSKIKARQLVTAAVAELKTAPVGEKFFETSFQRVDNFRRFLQTSRNSRKVAQTKIDAAFKAVTVKLQKERSVAADIRQRRRGIIEFDRHRKEATAVLEDHAAELKQSASETLTKEHLQNAFLMPIPDLTLRLESASKDSVKHANAGQSTEVPVKSSSRYAVAISDRIVRYFGLDPEKVPSPTQQLTANEDSKLTPEEAKALDGIVKQVEEVEEAVKAMLKAEDEVAKASMALADASEERAALARQALEEAKAEAEEFLRTVDAGEKEKEIEKQVAELAETAKKTAGEPTAENAVELQRELEELKKQIDAITPANPAETQAQRQAQEVLEAIAEELAETGKEAAEQSEMLAKAQQARQAAAARMVEEAAGLEEAAASEEVAPALAHAQQNELDAAPEQSSLSEATEQIASEANQARQQAQAQRPSTEEIQNIEEAIDDVEAAVAAARGEPARPNDELAVSEIQDRAEALARAVDDFQSAEARAATAEDQAQRQAATEVANAQNQLARMADQVQDAISQIPDQAQRQAAQNQWEQARLGAAPAEDEAAALANAAERLEELADAIDRAPASSAEARRQQGEVTNELREAGEEVAEAAEQSAQADAAANRARREALEAGREAMRAADELAAEVEQARGEEMQQSAHLSRVPELAAEMSELAEAAQSRAQNDLSPQAELSNLERRNNDLQERLAQYAPEQIASRNAQSEQANPQVAAEPSEAASADNNQPSSAESSPRDPSSLMRQAAELAAEAAQLQEAEEAVREMQAEVATAEAQSNRELQDELRRVARQAEQTLDNLAEGEERTEARQALAQIEQAQQALQQNRNPQAAVAQAERALGQLAEAVDEAPLNNDRHDAERNAATRAVQGLAQEMAEETAQRQAQANEIAQSRQQEQQQAAEIAQEASELGRALQQAPQQPQANEPASQRMPLLGRQLEQDAAQLEEAIRNGTPDERREAIDDLRRHAEMAGAQLAQNARGEEQGQEDLALADQAGNELQRQVPESTEAREQQALGNEIMEDNPLAQTPRGQQVQENLQQPSAMTPEQVREQAAQLAQAQPQDMNAQRALNQVRADALRRPEEAARNLEAAQAAAENQMQRAAELARGEVQEPLENAARNQQAAEGAATPEQFRNPRDELSRPEELALQHRARENRQELVEDALEEIEEARRRSNRMLEELDKNNVPEDAAELDRQIDRVEAMRNALGETEHQANRAMEEQIEPALERAAQGVEAAAEQAEQGLRNLDRELGDYERDLRDEASRLAAAEELREGTEQLGEAVNELARRREEMTNNEAAQQGRELAEQAARNVPEAQRERAEQLREEMNAALPGEQAQRMEQLAEALGEGNEQMQNQLRQQAEALRNNEQLQQQAAAMQQAAERAREQAQALGERLQQNQTPAAQQAARDLAELQNELGQNDVEGARSAAEQLAQAAEQLGPNPQPAPLNEEGFEAAAMAEALRNQQAVNRAQQGEFQQAEQSMRELAQQLPEGNARQLAEQSAEQFAEAARQQLEDLPNRLANAVQQAEQAAANLPQPAREALQDATRAARNGELQRAAEELAQVPQEQQQQSPVRNLANELNRAAQRQQEEIAQLTPQARNALEDIQQLQENAGAVPLADLGRAEQAVRDEDFEAAAESMTRAAMGLPGRQQEQALGLAERLQQPQMANQNNEGEQRAADQTMQRAMEAARRNDFEQAARESAQSPFGQEAAEQFAQANRQAQEAVRNAVEQAAAQEDYAQRRALANAAQEALQGDLRNAQQQANRAGEQGRQMAAALGEAQQSAQAAQRALEEGMQSAEQFSEQQAALESAQQAAQGNNFEQAAEHAAQSGQAPEAAAGFEQAEQQASQGIANALEQAASQPANSPEQQALTQAAQSAMADDLQAAIEQARRAGEAGEQAMQNFQAAQQSGQQASQQLAQSAEQMARNAQAAGEPQIAQAGSEPSQAPPSGEQGASEQGSAAGNQESQNTFAEQSGVSSTPSGQSQTAQEDAPESGQASSPSPSGQPESGQPSGQSQTAQQGAPESGQSPSARQGAPQSGQAMPNASQVQPLQNAMQAAQQGNLGEAAQQAGRVPEGQPASQRFAQAENELQDALHNALDRLAFEQDAENREALGEAIQSGLQGDLGQAIQQAQQAGQGAQVPMQSFQSAQQANEAGQSELQRAMGLMGFEIGENGQLQPLALTPEQGNSDLGMRSAEEAGTPQSSAMPQQSMPGQSGQPSGQEGQPSAQSGQPSGEQGQASGEQSAQSGQPSGEPGQPSVQSGQQSAQSGEPGQSGQQSAQSGQPGQQSGQPGQQSGQQSAQSGQPGQPGQQAGQPGQQSAQSGQPGQGQGQQASSQSSNSPSQGMSAQQQQQAQQGGQQAMQGLQRAQQAMGRGQVPQAQQGLQQAQQGLQTQEEVFRDLARQDIVNPSQPQADNYSGTPNSSPSQPTQGQPSSQQAGSQVGGGGSPGLRQSLSGGLSEYDQGQIIFNQNWDKVGEQLSNQSKQVKGYDIPPYFRGRIKEYFERIARERKKAIASREGSNK